MPFCYQCNVITKCCTGTRKLKHGDCTYSSNRVNFPKGIPLTTTLPIFPHFSKNEFHINILHNLCTSPIPSKWIIIAQKSCSSHPPSCLSLVRSGKGQGGCHWLKELGNQLTNWNIFNYKPEGLLNVIIRRCNQRIKNKTTSKPRSGFNVKQKRIYPLYFLKSMMLKQGWYKNHGNIGATMRQWWEIKK